MDASKIDARDVNCFTGHKVWSLVSFNRLTKKTAHIGSHIATVIGNPLRHENFILQKPEKCFQPTIITELAHSWLYFHDLLNFLPSKVSAFRI